MDFEITVVAGIAIIFGLVEGIKSLNLYEGKWNFVTSLVLGLAGGLVFFADGDIKNGVWTGLIMGLTASGFYSGAKNFLANKEV